MDVKIVSVNIGALSNDERPIFKVPSGYGGISLIAANLVAAGAGTSSIYLVDMGVSGTVPAGTLVTWGSVVLVANAPRAGTVNTAYLEAGHYLGVKEANVGALNAVTIVDVAYEWGK